ncbi:MAG: DUF72 domain-containing protein [Myxococcota bacterium]|nr:DUF72 domain-containing protein [Myxococcota bacterium]
MNEKRADSPAAQVLIGTSGQQPEKAYWSMFTVRELSPQFIETAKPKTLINLRKRTPAHGRFVVPILPDIVSHHFTGDQVDISWAKVLRAADILETDQCLLRTPADFRPTQANRDALIRFLNTRCATQVKVAWWAEGLWPSQPDAQLEIKAASSVTIVEDPFSLDDDEALMESAGFYWRVMGGRGMRRGLNDDELEQLMDESDDRAQGTIIFAGPAVQGDAQRFHRLMAMADGF